MTFKEAFVSFWKNYFNFTTRTSRSEFWFNFLWLVVVEFVLAFFSQDNSLGVSFLFNVIPFIPSLALFSRRCYDIGMNSNLIPWLVAFIVIADFFSLFGGAWEEVGLGWLADIITLGSLIALLLVGLKKSER